MFIMHFYIYLNDNKNISKVVNLHIRHLTKLISIALFIIILLIVIIIYQTTIMSQLKIPPNYFGNMSIVIKFLLNVSPFALGKNNSAAVIICLKRIFWHPDKDFM